MLAACVADVRYIFLVGGFSESGLLQHEIRREFGHLVKVIIPQDVALTILKGQSNTHDTLTNKQTNKHSRLKVVLCIETVYTMLFHHFSADTPPKQICA